MSCGVYVWAPGAEELWQLPYYRTWWHMPIPEDISPTTFELPNGLRYECLEPGRAYRVSYSDGEAISVEFVFTALHQPHYVAADRHTPAGALLEDGVQRVVMRWPDGFDDVDSPGELEVEVGIEWRRSGGGNDALHSVCAARRRAG